MAELLLNASENIILIPVSSGNSQEFKYEKTIIVYAGRPRTLTQCTIKNLIFSKSVSFGQNNGILFKMNSIATNTDTPDVKESDEKVGPSRSKFGASGTISSLHRFGKSFRFSTIAVISSCISDLIVTRNISIKFKIL